MKQHDLPVHEQPGSTSAMVPADSAASRRRAARAASAESRRSSARLVWLAYTAAWSCSCRLSLCSICASLSSSCIQHLQCWEGTTLCRQCGSQQSTAAASRQSCYAQRGTSTCKCKEQVSSRLRLVRLMSRRQHGAVSRQAWTTKSCLWQLPAGNRNDSMGSTCDAQCSARLPKEADSWS